MKKIMMIGFGTMAHEVMARLPQGVSVGWIVARPHHHQVISQLCDGQSIPLAHPDECQGQPDLVLECASQKAVSEYGESVLNKGWKLALISTGALADAGLFHRLRQAALQGNGELIILSGAVAGMDGLSAAREGGLDNVTYISRKSPASWRGSPAEQRVDLDKVSQATVFFEGSAREAASSFPANANVAATIALMGIGMDKTRVQMIVDPHTQKNTHNIHVAGRFGEFDIELNGQPLATNPKTSTLAALSAVQICRRLVSDGLADE
ncbi:aspartate dehydrogenase [Budviciaceae bacterium BWR-B9]|uniref:L-aspartate dehydrogenase n=1 Tax=Limnobaculum allomyrinae TaxID=2791986 RepID=A0ABS1IPE3_9GAMM|nr:MULTISPECIES: aspartate dehydrogenase [Limnobaculum]MBK5143632.1 aspartate dehydrogenase [Limnobaculum allomyrinae]MBV7692648.1 aspartate dehydrogenase [Limnobaculum sp. M2-1]